MDKAGKKVSFHSGKFSNTWEVRYRSTFFDLCNMSHAVKTSRILLKRYRISGQTEAAWFSLPIVDSKFANDTFLRKIISPNSLVHRLNFLDGRAISIFQVLMSHPRMVKLSDNWPSSASFPSDKQSSLAIGSFGSSGQHKV